MRKRAGVVIYNYKQDEILLIRRQKSGKNYYVIPGGGVEIGENIFDTAKRELQEELQYSAKCDFLFFDENNEYYFLDIVEESDFYEISGEERCRQSSDNIYQPIWIKTEYLKDITVYPQSIKNNIDRIKNYSELKDNIVDDKIIISIEGCNGSGRTTLIKRICNSMSFFYMIDITGITGKLENSDWWFEKSSPLEFTFEIVRMIMDREVLVRRDNHKFILLDKGIITFRARLTATLKLKRCTSQELEECLALFDKATEKVSGYKEIVLRDNVYTNDFLDKNYVKYEHDEIVKNNFNYTLSDARYYLENFKEIFENIFKDYLTGRI